MRRTLAIAGAAVLAVGGLAGSANAADTLDASIAVVQPVLVEIAVGLDASSPDHNIDGDYAVLENLGTADDLDGFELRGCNDVSDFPIFQYGTSHMIGADPTPFFLTADSTYSGGPSENVIGSFGALNQSDSGVYLEGPGGSVDGAVWGSPDECPSGLVTANNPPTIHRSLHEGSGSWFLDLPTPRNTSSM